MIKVESGGDAAVSLFGRAHLEETLQNNYERNGDDWLYTRVGKFVAGSVPVGTLVVDIFDGKSKKLIWRGSATNVVFDQPSTNGQKIDQSLQDMFKKFPLKAQHR